MRDMKNNDKKRLNIYVPPEVADWISNEANKHGLNDSAFARTLIFKCFSERNNANS